jgi:hypothetical protein
MAINPKSNVYRPITHWTQVLATVHMARQRSGMRKKTRQTLREPVDFPRAMEFARKFAGPIQSGKVTYHGDNRIIGPEGIFIFTIRTRLPIDGVAVVEVEGEGTRDESKVQVAEAKEPRGVQIITLAKALADRKDLIPFLFTSSEIEALQRKK